MLKKMMYAFCFISSFFISISAYSASPASTLPSCEYAPAIGTPKFCDVFKKIAHDRCMDNLHSEGACSNMTLIWGAMIGTYFTLERACAAQARPGQPCPVPAQECINDWNYYRAKC